MGEPGYPWGSATVVFWAIATNLRRATTLAVLAAFGAPSSRPLSAAAIPGTFYTGPMLINTGNNPDAAVCVSNPTSSSQTASVVYRKSDGSLESGPVSVSVAPNAFTCPTHNVQANITAGIEVTTSSTRMMPTLRVASPVTTVAAGAWRVIAAGGDDSEVLSDLSASAAGTSAEVAALESDSDCARFEAQRSGDLTRYGIRIGANLDRAAARHRGDREEAEGSPLPREEAAARREVEPV